MQTFQTQTFIPRDGVFSIALPEHLRGADVELVITKKETARPPRSSDEEYVEGIRSLHGIQASPPDLPDIPDETVQEYLEGIRSLRGILTGTPDYSDLRDETDREL